MLKQWVDAVQQEVGFAAKEDLKEEEEQEEEAEEEEEADSYILLFRCAGKMRAKQTLLEQSDHGGSRAWSRRCGISPT